MELSGLVDGQETRVRVVGDAPHDGTGEWMIYCGGAVLRVAIWPASQSRMERVCKIARAKAREREREATRGAVRAPMPGVVVEVRVRAGDQVAEGEAVVVLEAMKMRNELTAGESGTVGAVHRREATWWRSGRCLWMLRAGRTIRWRRLKLFSDVAVK